MRGPGVKRGDTVSGASLLDVTPTLLTLFGLPVGEDMDGKVLVHAFEEAPEIETVESWERIPGADGTHPAGFVQHDDDARAELQQLVELGYVEDPGEDVAAAVARTRDENDFYLARAYLDGSRYEEAIALLERLHADHPETPRYATRLAHAYQHVGRYKDCRRVVDHIREAQDRESPGLDVLEGNLLMAEGRHLKALNLFRKAEAEGGEQPHLWLRIAHAYLQLHRPGDAERAVRREIAQNPEEEHAYHTLGLVHLQQQACEAAADAFLQAMALRYHFPAAHFHLGEALFQLEAYEQAAEAYDVCLRLAPGLNQARQRLVAIHEQFLRQPGRALRYKTEWQAHLRGTVTVVSGLPRAGTSMLMQMLEAGGLPIFTDSVRAPDENNPRGYCEHEAVKRLARNKAWLPEAEGKAVKVVAQLLHHLPVNYRYRIVFVERDAYEVVRSQQKMRARLGRKVDLDALPMNLVWSYEKTVERVRKWAAERPNVENLYIAHRDVVAEPFAQALRVSDFLGGDLAVERMAAVVDGALYRERSGTAAAS